MATRWNEITQLISQTRLIPGSSLASASGKFRGDGTSGSLRFELEFLDASDVLIQSFAGATVTPGAGVVAESAVEGVLVPASAVKVRGVGVDLDDLGNPSALEWMLNPGPVVLTYRDPAYRIGRDGADAVDDGTARRVTTHQEADQATRPTQNLLGADAWPERGLAGVVGTAYVVESLDPDVMALGIGEVLSLRAVARNTVNGNIRIGLRFEDNFGTDLLTVFAADLFVTSVAAALPALQAVTIPEFTQVIHVLAERTTSIGGTAEFFVSRVMLNRGPVALAAEHPPLRAEHGNEGRAYKSFTTQGVLGAQTGMTDGAAAHVLITEGITILARDGDNVLFSNLGVTFQYPPAVHPGPGGLSVVPTGIDPGELTPPYGPVVRAVDLTASGFAVYARLEEVSGVIVPQSATFAADTPPAPAFTANKTTTATAWDDIWTYSYDAFVEPNSSITVEFYTNNGEGWDLSGHRPLINDDPVNGLTLNGLTEDILHSGLSGTGLKFGMDYVDDLGAGGSITAQQVDWGTTATPNRTTMTPTGASSIPFLVVGK